MGYMKTNVSIAGKVLVLQFQETQAIFLAPVKVMNEIPKELVFNWDKKVLHFVFTGQWTMKKAREKMIPISNSDDKHQITVVSVLVNSCLTRVKQINTILKYHYQSQGIYGTVHTIGEMKRQ